MNTYTNDCIGKKIVFKNTKECGIIIFFEYLSDLNHYRFKIKKENETITCFDDDSFIIV